MTKKNTNNDSKGSAWQQISSEVKYDNAWIRVSHDEVVTPANTNGIYGTVHFKHHAVGILVLEQDAQESYTYLVRQTRYVFAAPTWEIPEGGCPLGENILAAAKRELQEETGLTASDWQPWLNLCLSNSVTDEQATVFLAQSIFQGEANPEPTEDIEVLRLPLNDAVQMVLSGEITDAITVAALLKAAAIKE